MVGLNLNILMFLTLANIEKLRLFPYIFSLKPSNIVSYSFNDKENS